MSKLILNPEYELYERSGKPFCSSRQVAATFEKRHDHVLEAIRETVETLDELAAEKLSTDFVANFTPDFSGMNFFETKYKERGRFFPEFLLTKDGFAYIAMGFSGKKAAMFKVAYINRFKEDDGGRRGEDAEIF